ncbi:hypothetical protein KDA_73940 [Dictyobacter alpinus]|uniref:NmrA-like domain-containing protein n=1 Tax=Dictyobacter alpinus TaxID=2014873 RepID=A0A402BKR5_9CHLR|nr:hypothetical protein [Dictyobacter alpinus]GCE31910.1 hypothetical protein KDA_73940 [Dictyobacter alpinus]
MPSAIAQQGARQRDIAAVSAQASLDPIHAGHTYVLTGLQSLSQRDKVDLISRAIGKPVRWEEVPPQQFRQAMLAQGVPEDVPERIIGFWSSLSSQQTMPISPAVEQILGRPALTFAEWASEHAAAFWN